MAIRAEADTSDVKIAILRQTGVLQVLDLLTTLNIEDLSRTVATGGNKSSITAEANTADYALVGQVVDKFNIQRATDAGIEDGVPVFALTLEVSGQCLDSQIHQLVTATTELLSILLVLRQGKGLLLLSKGWGRSRTRHSGRTRVRVGVVLLRSSWNTRGAASVGSGLARARGGCGLGWCGTISCEAVLVG